MCSLQGLLSHEFVVNSDQGVNRQKESILELHLNFLYNFKSMALFHEVTDLACCLKSGFCKDFLLTQTLSYWASSCGENRCIIPYCPTKDVSILKEVAASHPGAMDQSHPSLDSISYFRVLCWELSWIVSLTVT